MCLDPQLPGGALPPHSSNMVIGWPYTGRPLSLGWVHFGGIWDPFGPILASKGPFLAIFSSNVAADRRHPGVGGPNLVARSALGRGNFGLSLGLRRSAYPRC